MNARDSPSIPLHGQAFISGFYSFCPLRSLRLALPLETLGSMKNRRNKASGVSTRHEGQVHGHERLKRRRG